jgi:hypothetical protein
MRFIFGVLLAALCVPCGSATVQAPEMAALADVSIRVFDLHAEGVETDFREFLRTVPMTNDRPVPGPLVDDTIASLSFLQATTPTGTPAYFVASWIHKTPLVSRSATDRSRYLERYGEDVYPQRVCPVFLAPGSGDTAELLSVATGLPARMFESVRGDVRSIGRLFALTEASHCGFIARELVQPTVLPPDLGQDDTRTILEALGDFEASVVTRSPATYAVSADEVDVLFAARLLATFFHERENDYTAVPGLILEYGRIGVPETHRELDRIRHSVLAARKAVRGMLGISGRSPAAVSLENMALALEAALGEGRLDLDDPLGRSLVAGLMQALRLLAGDRSARVYPGGESPHLLVTLPGPARL